MVFFSSCASVKFHSDLFNFVDMRVMDIHGKLKQSKRTSAFNEFVGCDAGTLFCTDVAARGLDIPGEMYGGCLPFKYNVYCCPAYVKIDALQWYLCANPWTCLNRIDISASGSLLFFCKVWK